MDEKSTGLSFLAECEKCKKGFKVDKTILQEQEFKVNEQSVFLTYYDCPNCGNRHIVQIDNYRSKRMLNSVISQFRKMAVAKTKGMIISQKQHDKFKKSRQHLSDYRITLMKEFTGKLAYDSKTDATFELRFSV